MDPSPRLTRWIERTFDAGDAATVLAGLRELPASTTGRQDPERIQAALVVGTGGDLSACTGRLALARQDWRDLLVAAGLEHADWPAVLDRTLGPPG